MQEKTQEIRVLKHYGYRLKDYYILPYSTIARHIFFANKFQKINSKLLPFLKSAGSFGYDFQSLLIEEKPLGSGYLILSSLIFSVA